jgi:hypothetical protein
MARNGARGRKLQRPQRRQVVAVDGFGFWVTSDDELNRMFGIRSL